MLWNLYFRERVNFGKQLLIRQKKDTKSSDPMRFEHDEDDKTRSATRIYTRLHNGKYVDSSGVERLIGGDTTKLFFCSWYE